MTALGSKAVKDRLANGSALAVGDTPEQFAAYIVAQQKIWKEIVEKAGLKAD